MTTPQESTTHNSLQLRKPIRNNVVYPFNWLRKSKSNELVSTVQDKKNE